MDCIYSRQIGYLNADDTFIIDTLEDKSSLDSEISDIYDIIRQTSRLDTYPYKYKQITIGQKIYPLIPEMSPPSLSSSQYRKARTQIQINSKKFYNFKNKK